MRHVFYGPAERVETAASRDEAVAQAMELATTRYPDRTFEVVAVTTTA
jgi:hypothetical protein